MKTCLALLPALIAVATASPREIILDTDMGNDIDDVQALALIHALQNRGELKLLAVTTSKDHALSAPFIDAMNTFYGRPDIPIGAVRNGATPDEGKYLGILHQNDEHGQPRFPHDLTEQKPAPEAVSLLRHILASRPDGAVHIAQVGFSTNLSRLLDSPPDAESPLDGVELVRRKVAQLVVMAGAFDTDGPYKGHREYNIVKDISSARNLVAKWPGPIVWSGFEVGAMILYPSRSIRDDYAYLPHHIIRESYLAYCGDQNENPTWDLTCPFWIAYPDRGYFDLSASGEVEIREDGTTVFHEKKGGRHRFLQINAPQTALLREAFMRLCSEPPAISGSR